jgi:hypothetical protein
MSVVCCWRLCKRATTTSALCRQILDRAADNAKEALHALGWATLLHHNAHAPLSAFIDYQDFFPRPNAQEVSDIFRVPVSWLLDPANLRKRPFGSHFFSLDFGTTSASPMASCSESGASRLP